MLSVVRSPYIRRTTPFSLLPTPPSHPVAHLWSAAAVYPSNLHSKTPAVCTCRRALGRRSATRECPVPNQEEIIRSYMDELSKDHEEYAAQLAESLAALESYEQQLHQWQTDLAAQSQLLAEQSRELEEERKQFIKQQATDVAMTAELDQARAEIDDLRQRLAEVNDTMFVDSGEMETEPATTAPSKKSGGVGLLDPTVSAVAKQFHKLRQQQAARRTGSRPRNGN